jgi:hypothetical protein
LRLVRDEHRANTGDKFDFIDGSIDLLDYLLG